jgi:23S rRNA pseudouridine2457 synthase
MLLLLNKPFNTLCQFTDSEKRRTLADFVTTKGVYPAGRLDRDSEGLVLLTDDGALQHHISHPRHKLEKTYWVQVEGQPDEQAIAALCTGIQLKDGKTAPARARIIPEPALWPRQPPIRVRAQIPTTWLELTISEGRNRQVRRMTAAIGHPTLRLVRSKIGPWSLGDLAPGEWREAQIPEEWRTIRGHEMDTPSHRSRRHRRPGSLPHGRGKTR